MKRVFKFVDYYFDRVIVALRLRKPTIYIKHESYSLGHWHYDKSWDEAQLINNLLKMQSSIASIPANKNDV